ncbi:MAG: hypothetical protein IT349_20620 [Candidatus Eisenbacteria bacterium]|nr:hypothetical protein [Candidatus Eisenbacteria bacterium]
MLRLLWVLLLLHAPAIFAAQLFPNDPCRSNANAKLYVAFMDKETPSCNTALNWNCLHPGVDVSMPNNTQEIQSPHDPKSGYDVIVAFAYGDWIVLGYHDLQSPVTEFETQGTNYIAVTIGHIAPTVVAGDRYAGPNQILGYPTTADKHAHIEVQLCWNKDLSDIDVLNTYHNPDGLAFANADWMIHSARTNAPTAATIGTFTMTPSSPQIGDDIRIEVEVKDPVYAPPDDNCVKMPRYIVLIEDGAKVVDWISFDQFIGRTGLGDPHADDFYVSSDPSRDECTDAMARVFLTATLDKRHSYEIGVDDDWVIPGTFTTLDYTKSVGTFGEIPDGDIEESEFATDAVVACEAGICRLSFRAAIGAAGWSVAVERVSDGQLPVEVWRGEWQAALELVDEPGSAQRSAWWYRATLFTPAGNAVAVSEFRDPALRPAEFVMSGSWLEGEMLFWTSGPRVQEARVRILDVTGRQVASAPVTVTTAWSPLHVRTPHVARGKYWAQLVAPGGRVLALTHVVRS